MMRHLVIMVKRPQAGRVKTRLARQIGAAEAVRVYRTLLHQAVRKLACDPRWQTWLAVTPDPAITDRVWPRATGLMEQGRGDLGERMARVFETLPPGPAAIIGSDIPGIDRSDIWQAFRALGANDAVFGPAPDGGYWLVGTKRQRPLPGLFQNVRWSSEHTLADTLRNLHDRKIALLREIADLDEIDGYRRWRKTGIAGI